jgi:hypothetical protein
MRVTHMKLIHPNNRRVIEEEEEEKEISTYFKK